MSILYMWTANHVLNIQVPVDGWMLIPEKNVCEYALCDLSLIVKEMMEKKKIRWVND